MAKLPNGSYIRWLDEQLLVETDACIIWPFKSKVGSTNSEYGGMGANGTAHRYVCEKAHGPCPNGYEARHSCGLSLCCNNRHLSWRTHVDNEFDKVAHGTRQIKTSFTPDKIVEVFELRSRGLTQKQIADIFGSSQASICKVLKRGAQSL